MTAAHTIATLLATARAPANRKAARAAWTKQRAAAWRDAQRQMDARCDDAVDRLSEEEFQAFAEAEQAKVDAIRAELTAVIDHDKWPKHLYWPDL